MTLKHLRIIAIIEGTTLILLLLVAMPLKYKFDMPIAVSMIGPIHGIAFLVYVGALMTALLSGLINSIQLIIGAVAAFIPFGSFIFERFMLKEQVRV
ncbi:MAG: Unknown protein [uncultured Thiotrichaceae bacterium]|uniref:DUF3817 domain-containing protein n=1 Tax=uncultured Thiotrichaceae bacterium TaxID=298394 RepID=A0A6S6T4J4_9GAMM|nr:MAG: Unknown protein [uncultured Thiotrichaceae bacterium]